MIILVRHDRGASDGVHYSFRHVPQDSSVVQLAVTIFDILLFNGRKLTNATLEDRLKVLAHVLKEQADDTIFYSERTIGNSK